MALRCLIVDDSARFLDAARELLEREGITVVGVASNSAEALERARELRPDVALVDIDLGAESGFDLARRIAEAPTPLPVILISTRSEDDLAELIETSPALGYLSKVHLTAHAVRNLLAGGKCAHEALVYSTVEEFLAATVPFIREGLSTRVPSVCESSASLYGRGHQRARWPNGSATSPPSTSPGHRRLHGSSAPMTPAS